MAVVLDRIQDGDWFGYPLVRVVGTIVGVPSDEGKVIVRVSATNGEEWHSEWEIYRSCFKGLIPLKNGKNRCIFSCEVKRKESLLEKQQKEQIEKELNDTSPRKNKIKEQESTDGEDEEHTKGKEKETAGTSEDNLNICKEIELHYRPNLGKRIGRRPHFVRMVYLLSSDDEGDYQAPPDTPNSLSDAIQRLKFAALLMQSFCADSMMDQGFGRRTFRLELDEDSTPKIWVFRSSLSRREIYALGDDWKDQGACWSHFNTELEDMPQRRNSIDCVIMSMTRQFWIFPHPPTTERDKEKIGKDGIQKEGSVLEKETESEKETARESGSENESENEKEDCIKKNENENAAAHTPVAENENESKRKEKENKGVEEETEGSKKNEMGEKEVEQFSDYHYWRVPVLLSEEDLDEADLLLSDSWNERSKPAREKALRAHTAMGGGHLGLFGSGCLHTWATGLDDIIRCWSDERDLSAMCDSEGNPLMEDSCHRKSMWANFATTLGATMHEVGHCFGLPHTYKGVMSRGFDHFNQFFMIREKGIDGPLVKDHISKYGKGEGGAHWDRHSAVLLRHSPYIVPMHTTHSTLSEVITTPRYIEIPLAFTLIRRIKGRVPASDVVMIDAIGAPMVMVEFRSDQGTVFMHRELEVTGDSRRDTFCWSVALEEVVTLFLCNARLVHKTNETCEKCLIRVLNACGMLEEEEFVMPIDVYSF